MALLTIESFEFKDGAHMQLTVQGRTGAVQATVSGRPQCTIEVDWDRRVIIVTPVAASSRVRRTCVPFESVAHFDLPAEPEKRGPGRPPKA